MLELIRRHRSEFQDTITIVVGHEAERRFTVHQDLVCHRSPFFKGACTRGWMEAEEKIVRLPDHRPVIFKLYLECAYSHTKDLEIHVRRAAQQRASVIGSEELRMIENSMLRSLWFLADYLGDTDCMNRAMDTLRAFHPDGIMAQVPMKEWDDMVGNSTDVAFLDGLRESASAANGIMEKARTDSGMQRLVASQLASILSPAWLDLVGDKFTRSTLMATLKDVVSRDGVFALLRGGPQSFEPSKYHE